MNRRDVRALSNELKARAIADFGLCAQGAAEWGDNYTKGMLLDKYVNGIEFILNHPDFITDDFLIEKAGRDLLHAHGIWIDDKLNIYNPGTVVLNGNCEGTITANGFSAPEIYLRGSGNVELLLDDAAIVHVSIYDTARLEVDCSRFAKCFIYRYGGNVEMRGEGKVLIRERKEKYKN